MNPRAPASLLLVAALAGCATTERTEPVEAAVEPAAFVILETLPPSGVVLGTDLYPCVPGAVTLEILPAGFQRPEPDRAARRVVRTASVTEEHGAAIALALGEERTEFLTGDEEGNTVMPAVVEHARAPLTRFDPPLLVCCAALPAGAERRTESEMLVLDSRNPARRREAGRAVRTIAYLDDQRVSGPLGTHRAQRVRVRFTAALRLARAEDTVTFWVVPGLGVIAEEREERLTVLGLEGTPKRRCLLRVREPGSPPR